MDQIHDEATSGDQGVTWGLGAPFALGARQSILHSVIKGVSMEKIMRL